MVIHNFVLLKKYFTLKTYLYIHKYNVRDSEILVPMFVMVLSVLINHEHRKSTTYLTSKQDNYLLTYLLTHSLTHSLTHLLTHSLTYSLTHSLTQSLTSSSSSSSVGPGGYMPPDVPQPVRLIVLTVL
jgi:hypothetical protein